MAYNLWLFRGYNITVIFSMKSWSSSLIKTGSRRFSWFTDMFPEVSCSMSGKFSETLILEIDSYTIIYRQFPPNIFHLRRNSKVIFIDSLCDWLVISQALFDLERNLARINLETLLIDTSLKSTCILS